MRTLLSNGNRINLLLYLLSFFLLWEWLRPVLLLTDTGNIRYFLIFIILSLLLSYFHIRLVLGSVIKIIYIVLALSILYFKESIFQLKTVFFVFQDIAINIGLVIGADWNELTNLFRSFLFFLLLWLITYLIRYWLVVRKQMFLFFLMSLVYITVLDTFTEYDADYAIVRTVASGFIMMGVLCYERLIARNRILKQISFSKQWLIPLVSMILFCVVVGFALPKSKPIWPDPVPFIKSFNKDSGGQTVNKIGYGEDDRNLGGPFINDDTVVMRVESNEKHYWKVETKFVYTGKGWIVPTEFKHRLIPFNKLEIVPLFPIEEKAVKVNKQTSTVTSALHGYSFIAYPFGVTSINSISNVSFQVDRFIEKITSIENKDVFITNYIVEFNRPQYSLKALKQEALNDNNESEFFKRTYLQIPEKLPERIRELTLEITADKKSWYEKAKAVESYLKGVNFVYDQVNVPIPEENQDYVDQFLFETKRGYCNNFSTSMAVMLRTIGIPTRWVKGFTGGEYKGPGDNSRSMYEITNNNAHSWVEVYIPSVGWVPFEPTPSFQNNVLVINDLIEQKKEEEDKKDKERDETTAPNKKKQNLEDDNNSSSFSSIWLSVKGFFNKNLKLIIITATLILLFMYFFYRTRMKWLPQILIIKYKGTTKDENFVKAYLALLKQLERIHIKRKQGQTLREFAKYVDDFYTTNEMSTLTAIYEQYLYKGDLREGTWNESKELWENLINKIKG